MIEITNKVEEFGALIRQIGAGLEAAGKMLVEMLALDPQAKKKIRDRFPEISNSMLNQLEAVGRGQMHPRLALTANPGFQRLRGLPYSDQERLLSEPVELLVEHEGEIDVLLVQVADLTPDQARQVFAQDCVRSQGAQRAWLEDQREKALVSKRAVTISEPYQIHRNGTVEFKAGTVLTRRDLAEVLAKLV